MAVAWRTALFEHLKADATLAGLVGTRIYAGAVDPEIVTKPFVYTVQGSSRPIRHLSGGSERADVTLGVMAIGRTHVSAFDVAEAVREALDNFKGDLNPLAGIDYVKAFVRDTAEFAIPPADGGDPDLFQVTTTVDLFVRESATP